MRCLPKSVLGMLFLALCSLFSRKIVQVNSDTVRNDCNGNRLEERETDRQRRRRRLEDDDWAPDPRNSYAGAYCLMIVEC